MIHFIRQMQAYARLEVVECSWMKLINFLNKKEGDLDALIEAHRNYLDQMMKKIFLRSPKAGKEVFFEFSFGPYCHLMVLPLPSIGKSTQPSPWNIWNYSPISYSYSLYCFLLPTITSVWPMICLLCRWQDHFYNSCLSESSKRDQELDAQRVRFFWTHHGWTFIIDIFPQGCAYNYIAFILVNRIAAGNHDTPQRIPKPLYRTSTINCHSSPGTSRSGLSFFGDQIIFLRLL